MAMQGSSVEWTEEYRPKKLKEVVGNGKATEELKGWAEDVHKAKSKKAAILHGPPGCGKTSAAYALASELGWEVIELNASDQRSEGVIKSIVGPASASNTFSKTTRLIILDEADNIHGKEDRGGTKAITEIVKRSTQPIILIANDKYRMGKALQRNCRAIKFQRIKPGTVFRVLKEISDEEVMEISDETLLLLAKNANGDLRSAINDLQAISMSGLKLEKSDIATGERDVEEDIFDALNKIFGGYDMQEALLSLYGIDKTPEESIQWIYKNFSFEYDEESFLHGLHYLSRADTFLGRVKRRENYKFWRYASSLMACGVLSAKEMQGGRREGWRRQYFRSPWQREQRSGGDRKSAPIREEIAKKIGAYCKVPLSYARFFVVPFLNFFFLDERKAVDITASLRLDVPQIAFLLRDTDKEGEEKAKRIYHEAFAVGVGKREVEAVTVGESKKEEIERTKEGEEEEKEARNQKTFADFF
ncbi:MAG: replication factor C large subunit [Halobacteriota archaeon]